MPPCGRRPQGHDDRAAAAPWCGRVSAAGRERALARLFESARVGSANERHRMSAKGHEHGFALLAE